MEGKASLRELVGRMSEGLTAMRQLESVLYQAGGPELGELFGTLDAMKRVAQAGQVAVLAEAIDRGEARSAATGGSEYGWITHWGPSYVAEGTSRLLRVTEAVRSGGVEQFASAVRSGRVGVANADLIWREMGRLAPRLRPEAVPTVWDGYLTLGETCGRREILALRQHLLAEYAPGGELQADHDAATRLRGLSQPFQDDGTFQYRLVLDAEGSCALEAALGPLAAPRPSDGMADLRSSDQRRADALVAASSRRGRRLASDVGQGAAVRDHET
jgi:Domain of unknown function (DUF222)